jgi:hypothetical protein
MSRINQSGFLFALAFVVLGQQIAVTEAQVIPGTGTKYTQYGDDFEAANWKYVYNLPKSSKEQDEQLRYPRGYATNQRWFESPKRGTPDEITIVETPAGGIEGSKHAMAIRTQKSGIPGRISYDQMQDDLIMNGRYMTASQAPSGVVRVYLPPFEEWENRSGAHFGIRADCSTTVYEAEKSEGRGIFKAFKRSGSKQEAYWPGFFICFNSETDSKKEKKDFAYIIIRGDKLGHEIPGPRIDQPGWWTLGISISADGMVHFYGKPGVENLTAADHITSQFCYGYKCETFSTIFFNSVNMEDGKTWSTKFIIDDPALYYNGTTQQVVKSPKSTITR